MPTIATFLDTATLRTARPTTDDQFSGFSLPYPLMSLECSKLWHALPGYCAGLGARLARSAQPRLICCSRSM